MEDQACRVVLQIANRGTVEFPWMESKEHAIAAIQCMRTIAEVHDGVEIISAIIVCKISYIV